MSTTSDFMHSMADEINKLRERNERMMEINKHLSASFNTLLVENSRMQDERDAARTKVHELESNIEIWKGREWLALAPKMMELAKQIKEIT